jgi:phosphopantothenoylcysteine decarboxylase / phosphopantothenate---cysteine ligase
VGFAAESEDLVRHARDKLRARACRWSSATSARPPSASDHNTLVLVDEAGETSLPEGPKLHLARELVREIARRSPPKTT